MRVIATLVGCVLVASTVGAVAQARKWTIGGGQGIYEYTVKNGPGNTFGIACDSGHSDNGELTNLTVEIGGKRPASKSTIRVFIDDEDFEIYTGPTGAMKFNNIAATSTFTAMWEALRNGKQLRVLFADGQTTTFPMAGAAKLFDGEPCKTGL